jgi:hypothetical protein
MEKTNQSITDSNRIFESKKLYSKKRSISNLENDVEDSSQEKSVITMKKVLKLVF